jgi:hypothetical protein
VWGAKEVSGTTYELRAVWGSSATDVYAVGTTVLLHSAGDGNWAPQATGTTGTIQSLWGSSANDVYVGGSNGKIIHSTGHGDWNPQTTGTTANIAWLWGTSATDVYAISDDVNGTPIIYHSAGDGKWTAMWQGLNQNTLTSGWGSASNDVYAVGFGSDSPMVHYDGTNYSVLRPGGGSLFSIWGSSSSDIYLVGESATILHGSGSGPWTAQGGALSSAFWFNAVWGSSDHDIFAVGVRIGSGGAVACHSKGDGVWTSLPNALTGLSDSLNAVWGSSASDVYAVGFNGAILHSKTAL